MILVWENLGKLSFDDCKSAPSHQPSVNQGTAPLKFNLDPEKWCLEDQIPLNKSLPLTFQGFMLKTGVLRNLFFYFETHTENEWMVSFTPTAWLGKAADSRSWTRSRFHAWPRGTCVSNINVTFIRLKRKYRVMFEQGFAPILDLIGCFL